MKKERFEVLKFYDSRLTLFSDGTLSLRNYSKDLSYIDSDFEPIELTQDLFSFKPRTIKVKSKPLVDGIRSDSLARTRNLIIDYAHENYSIWHTFITLTFKKNLTDINLANKKFNSWVLSVRRIYSNFAYLCVPEFQKRGAVHYHLITNLSTGDEICTLQDKKKSMYDVKYWKHGFSSVFDLSLTDDKFNVALYVTKYLYKDIDNRLYGHIKCLHSNNLKKPVRVRCTDELISQISSILNKYKFTEYSFKAKEKFQVSFKERNYSLDKNDFYYIQKFLDMF